MAVEFPDGVVEMVNQRLGGYDAAMGLTVVSARPDEVVGEIEIGDVHRQPYGLVHGGVYAGMIESLCSIAAALNVFADGRHAVGLDNATSFLHAVRQGKLTCTARPLVRSRRSHVWQGDVVDQDGRVVASGRVRMLIMDAGSKAAGATVTLDGP